MSCAEALVTCLPDCTVTLISASPLIKAVRNIKNITRTLTTFHIDEAAITDYETENPRIKVLHTEVVSIDYTKKCITTSDGEEITYDKVCVCTGARPKTLPPIHDRILTIRDTQTARELDETLANSRRVIVVGNGGIANEIVFRIRNCEIIWVIKDKSIGNVFFDAGAAGFFMPLLLGKDEHAVENKEMLKLKTKRMTYTSDRTDNTSSDCRQVGGALGPDWYEALQLKGIHGQNSFIQIEYETEIESHEYTGNNAGGEWPLRVVLKNGKVLEADYIISAIGVTPNSELFLNTPAKINCTDNGVEVDTNMRVLGLKDTYAAGDICSTSSWPYSEHWFQMRLWTQARQMGIYAARCMFNDVTKALTTDDNLPLDICFDIFAHTTRFYGKKVVLLGRYNAQCLDSQKSALKMLIRTTDKEEYIKVLLLNGKMCGAVLIGETDLEETFENLILNGLDLDFLGEDLLDPDVDIADYFD